MTGKHTFTMIDTPTMERIDDVITLPDAPAIRGLAFRGFRGEADYPAMLSVIEGSKEADRIDRVDTLEDIARNYRHLFNCDPYRDMLFAELHSQVIGYSRVWWQQEQDGKRRYEHFAFLLPAWRFRGIRRAMLLYNERRLREIADDHNLDPDQCVFQVGAADSETDWQSLLHTEGYQAVRYAFQMVRPDLENIPHLPLPEGLEVRPVRPEHYRTIWRAAEEAFRDEWAETEWQDEWFESWQESPNFNPDLWQVAWDGDQVAGMVQNFIDHRENEAYDRKRGYTEGICVRRPWRRRGLARALIARSFKVLKAQGMAEAALGVDAENPSGALQLYESMGFRQVKRYTVYRKPLG